MVWFSQSPQSEPGWTLCPVSWKNILIHCWLVISSASWVTWVRWFHTFLLTSFSALTLTDVPQIYSEWRARWVLCFLSVSCPLAALAGICHTCTPVLTKLACASPATNTPRSTFPQAPFWLRMASKFLRLYLPTWRGNEGKSHISRGGDDGEETERRRREGMKRDLRIQLRENGTQFVPPSAQSHRGFFLFFFISGYVGLSVCLFVQAGVACEETAKEQRPSEVFEGLTGRVVGCEGG